MREDEGGILLSACVMLYVYTCCCSAERALRCSAAPLLQPKFIGSKGRGSASPLSIVRTHILWVTHNEQSIGGHAAPAERTRRGG